MFFVLFLLWIVFAGHVSVLNCVSGAAASAAVTLFCWKFMGYQPLGGKRLLRRMGRAARYFPYLMKEIFLSNLAVLRRIYSRREPESVLVHFTTPLQTDFSQTLVASSITLTPGTITVDTRDGEYWVHALDAPLADGIEHCEFIRRAKELEE